jgi:hypothetical protein
LKKLSAVNWRQSAFEDRMCVDKKEGVQVGAVFLEVYCGYDGIAADSTEYSAFSR